METLKEITIRTIKDRIVLKGSKTAAAESLGITTRTIRNYLSNGYLNDESEFSLDRSIKGTVKLDGSLRNVLKQAIIDRLEHHLWSRKKTAESLDISIRTLGNHISRYRKEGAYIKPYVREDQFFDEMSVRGMATNKQRLDYYDLKWRGYHKYYNDKEG